MTNHPTSRSGGAVFPVAFAITWRGQSRAGAIAGALSGLAAGLIAWLVTAKQYFGTLTVDSTGQEYSTLAGNLAAIMTGLIVTVVVSLIKPQNFDWAITRAINAVPVTAGVKAPMPGIEGLAAADPTLTNDEEKEKEAAGSGTLTPEEEDELPTMRDEDEERAADAKLEENPNSLRGAFKLACIASFVLTFIMDFIVSFFLKRLLSR